MVACIDTDRDRAEAIVAGIHELGGKAHSIVADLRRPTECSGRGC
ncbi:hypothetical protein GCM10009836_24930 [Pseudonocardia ailaonensis]|uniref:Uncharacterized protein n=1 Tax=Pseudonocardia ailaonensis TaxID=367279 RepID=A0ABN2N065_9PSEU